MNSCDDRAVPHALPRALDSRDLQGETRCSPVAMHGSTQPEEVFPSTNAADTTTGTGPAPSGSASSDPAGAVGGRPNGGRGLEETELDSALQLLVERAQY